MAAAPMKYQPDGSVDWGNMWDSFCILAREGGPPHRGNMLYADEDADITSDGYQFAVAEIIRGIAAVSGLVAAPSKPGWIEVQCASASMANWLAESIVEENVEARADGSYLLVPVGAHYTLKGEIKNVITAVAKTAHYWGEHVPAEVKQTLALQAKIVQLKAQAASWLRSVTTRQPHASSASSSAAAQAPQRRERLYRGDRPPPDVRGQTVILVDDGLATGRRCMPRRRCGTAYLVRSLRRRCHRPG
jgi:sirohydrochlorin cobaltochelatase